MTAPEHEEAPVERELDEGSENHLAAGLAQKATRTGIERARATINRIGSIGLVPHEYDVVAIVESIVRDGVDLADINDQDFLYLLTHHVLEDKTELPCPSWCQRDAGHPFESHNPLTGRQSRPHSLVLASGEGVYVAVVQDDEREPGDDSTVVQGAPFVTVEIESDLDAASLRRRAADLLNAADRLDGITGDVRWTEDAL